MNGAQHKIQSGFLQGFVSGSKIGSDISKLQTIQEHEVSGKRFQGLPVGLTGRIPVVCGHQSTGTVYHIIMVRKAQARTSFFQGSQSHFPAGAYAVKGNVGMNMGIQHEWGPFRKCTYYQYCTAKIAFLQGSFRPTCRK